MSIENLLTHQHHQVMEKLNILIALLTEVKKEEDAIVQELDDLTAQVKANTDVEQSAVVLIQGIAAKLAANTTDPAAIKALSDKLSTSAAALAAAITANTPAASA